MWLARFFNMIVHNNPTTIARAGKNSTNLNHGVEGVEGYHKLYPHDFPIQSIPWC
jgi:hypothetical protein